MPSSPFMQQMCTVYGTNQIPFHYHGLYLEWTFFWRGVIAHMYVFSLFIVLLLFTVVNIVISLPCCRCHYGRFTAATEKAV